MEVHLTILLRGTNPVKTALFCSGGNAIWVECIVDALSDELPYGRMGLLEVPLYF